MLNQALGSRSVIKLLISGQGLAKAAVDASQGFMRRCDPISLL